MLRKLTAALGTMCVLAAAAPATGAASLSPTADCQAHGHLTQHYSVSQLRSALAGMPADVQEYTNCYNVIQEALLGQIKGTNGSTSSSDSSGSSFLPTWVIVVIVVIALGGATAGALAIRRRSGES